jgi:DNA primase
MNIVMARAIPMPEILRKIGLQPAKPGHKDYWYYSPFRTEKTPSFHVNLYRNVWYDFG